MDGHARLLVVAWHLKDAKTAKRVLGSWRAAVAKRHPVILKLADGAFLLRAGGANAPGLAVVRVGPVVAALRFETSARGKAIDDFLSGEVGTESEQISGAISQTGFELLSYKVSKHHGLTRSLALQAFALIGGRGPGVPRPPSPAGYIAGTQALDWVIEELPHFSKAERRAVGTYLARTFPPHASPPLPANGVARAAGAVSASDYQTIANEMLSRIETHTGPLGINPIVNKATTGVPGDYAETSPYRSCSITVFPDTDSLHPWEQQHMVAHELGHCMQHKYNTFGLVTSRPAWLLDGPPEWIADEVVPIPAGASASSPVVSPLYDYDNQIGDPLDGLFTGYEGAGFLGHVADQAGENTIWARMPQIMVQTDTAGGLAATVGANAQEVYDAWGGSYAQRTDLGLNWERINPYPGRPSPPTDPHAKHVIVPAGTVTLPAPAQTGQLYRVDTTQPFLRIDPQAQSFGRIVDAHRGNAVEINQTAGQLYCTISSCDQCPPATQGTPPPSKPLAMPLLIGLSGGTPPATDGDARMTGEPWSRYCHATKPPPGGGGGGAGGGGAGGSSGSSGGDPHLVTLAGDRYDFQGAGEFTLLKSTNDNLEVQAREQPFPGSKYLAINTAVAMRVAGATVEVDSGRSAGTMSLWLNGHRTNLGSSKRLRGGGRIGYSAVTKTLTVSWPDGTQALVLPAQTAGSGLSNSNSIDVALKAARGRAGHLSGLLGDAGAAGGSEFVGRDGRRYSAGAILSDSPSGFALLYGNFGQSWRIRQRDSLFHYARGKGTGSYTIRGFPKGFHTVRSLSPAAFASGKHACVAAGVSGQSALDDCILDVGATGVAGFAGGDARLQAIMGAAPGTGGRGNSPIPWTRLSSQPDNDIILVPSLASQGSQMVAAYQNKGASIEVGTFTASAAGVTSVSRVEPFTGWNQLGDPLLFPDPGGGLQMIFSGIHSINAGDPLNGTVLAQRHFDGSFGTPEPIAAGVATVQRGAVLSPDGATPLWAASYGGSNLLVERGAPTPVATDLSSLVKGGTLNPTIAYDRTGRLWLAWYALANNPAQSGLYMLQLDPATGAAAPGATPVLAPESQSSDNGLVPAALACAQACRLVYEPTGSISTLVSWAPGDAGPSTVASDPSQVADPAAAYTADGRLWVAWRERSTGRLVAKLGDGSGSGGAQVELPSPAGYDLARDSAALANGQQLVLVTNWESYASHGTGVFATIVNTP